MISSSQSTEKPVTISVDVMSGDLGPEHAIRGAAQATLETPYNVLLVGNERIIKGVLEDAPHNPNQIEILHAPLIISMEDDPKEAVELKTQSSLFIAVKAAAEKRCDGVVSAGNTGAYILVCSKLIPRLPGVKKTALGAVYPTSNKTPSGDRFALLLDVGTTIRCTTEELVQFALMGNAYARKISKVERPSVALLNIGVEPHKGGEIMVRTHRYLAELPGIHFIGNVEGSDLPIGLADVVVCEGFVGNVALKLAEGLQNVLKLLGREAFKRRFLWKLGILMLAGGLKQLKRETDYSEYGGAPILGYERIAIKAHGKSNTKAFMNAIKVAGKAIRGNVSEEIKSSIEEFAHRYPVERAGH